jgi:hypothetical protein
MVLIIKQYAYRGTNLVTIPQPDGSVACIPAWMTHESAAQHEVCVDPVCLSTSCVLYALRWTGF